MAPNDLDRIEPLNNSIPLSFRARHRTSAVLSANDRPSHRSVRSQKYGFDDYTDDRRFDLFRILACYQVRTLLVEPDFESHERWIWRERLGIGGSFAVHEATLPVSSVFSGRLRYRDFKVKSSSQGPIFQDHTLATWSYGSNVAFKTSNVDPDSIITELRVLCHEPFQDHPNIVHLIGIAWITDHSSQGNTGRREVLEWPAILLEKAPYGSLNDFLIASGSGISLKTKVLLCVEILKAIKVCRCSMVL